jgi:glycosyltransferase involved in cell wall biosynthesis
MAIYWGRRGGGLALFNQFVEDCKDEKISIIESLRPTGTLKDATSAPISILKIFTWINTRKAVLSTVLDQNVRTVVFVMASPWDIFLGKKLMASGISVVRIIHDGSPHPGEYFPSKFWIRWLTRDCSRIITLSQYVANQLVANFGVNPNSIKVCDFPVPRVKISEFSKVRQIKKVLLIGRGKKYQGQSLLEEAWALIDIPDAILVIAGEGFNVNDEHPSIEYRNYWMTDQELADEIATSDLVVFPYLEASQSGTIPLCRYLGIPVIVTPVGGLPEQVIERVNGLITEDVSAKSLSETITVALNMNWEVVTRQRSVYNHNFAKEVLSI